MKTIFVSKSKIVLLICVEKKIFNHQLPDRRRR